MEESPGWSPLTTTAATATPHWTLSILVDYRDGDI